MSKQDLTIKILGAGREVGRAAVLLSIEEKHRILFDYGVDISGEEPEFPLHVPPRDIDFVALSHAHLDHSGGVPLLYVGKDVPLYTTSLTIQLSELLIKDFLKLSKYYVPYETIELSAMIRNAVNVAWRNEIQLDSNITLTFYNAGHIPGSSLIMVDTGNYRILYTGDFNLCHTCTLDGADISPFKNADIIIMEGTYARFNHPIREEVEKDFLEAVGEVIDSGGTVLVPSFAVGRAQEIACVLAKSDLDVPIYIDGMAKTVSDIMLDHRDMLSSRYDFGELYSRIRKVKNWRQRKKIVEKPCVIISPAGMLKGGASVFYMQRICENSNNAVFFVSYLIKDSPGRKVLLTGEFESPTAILPVKARVEWFDFSSHCGHRELIEALKFTKRSAKIILIHCEENTGTWFAQFIEEKLGREVYYPSNGEEISIG